MTPHARASASTSPELAAWDEGSGDIVDRRSNGKTTLLTPSDGVATGHFLQPKWGNNPWGGGTMSDRFDAILPLIRDGSLLDVGCASRYGKPDWFHGLLAKKFGDVVGIDINETVIKSLQAEGFNTQVGDARAFDLGRRFDTVFAGELIEHIDDVRGFLSSVRRHLHPGGQLVLTTPNVFYVGGFIYRWGGHGQVHPEHTCWYCEDTLRHVLQVNGFSEVEISFTGHTSPTRLRKMATVISRGVLAPRLALDTLVAVATFD
jgi:2-polyprenyl-3-methyl-5-hydroxy-6-metoxy-1,4-benzoquinol methylase